MPRRLRLIVTAAIVAVALPHTAPFALAGEATQAPAAAVGDTPQSPEALLARWRAKPGSVGRGLRLQDVYVATDRKREIQEVFRDHHKARPDDHAAAFLYGRIKGGSSGIRLMRKAMAANLGRAEGDTSGLLRGWTALMLAEVAAGNAEEAEKAATRVTSMRGLAADWTYLGWIQESLLEAPDRARDSYTRAIRADENHTRARLALAMIHADADEVDAALALTGKAVKLQPENAKAQLNHGLVLAMAGKNKDAANAYKKALTCAGDDADALSAIASGFLDIEEQALAQEAVSKALAVDPEHADALGNAGLLALERDALTEAAAHLKKAVKLEPKSAHLHYLQGICAQRQGRNSAAVNHLRKAMSLEPESVEYVTALALAQLKKGSTSSAISMFKRAIKMAPKDADLHLQLGIAYYKHRKHKLALKAFEAMVEVAPEDPRARYYLAIIYGDKLGKAKEAIAHLKAYRDLGGREPSALAWLDELLEELGQG